MTTAANVPAAESVEPPVAVASDATPAPELIVAEPVERPRRKLSLHYGARPGEKP